VHRILIERSAAKTLIRLPANVAGHIEDKIEQLAADPHSLRNNVTKLVGTKESRLRIGDWRVIFRIDGDTLIVIRIAPRGSAYE
jgi:mRNA interferase RelE/StbE